MEDVSDRSIVLRDVGFNAASGIPDNLKLCPRGTWNERMLVETMLSMITMVCSAKKMFHRVRNYMEMHFAYLSSLFNPSLHGYIRTGGAHPCGRRQDSKV